MTSAIQQVLDILDLEPLEVNLFRGRSPQARWQRVFGGQVIGQALVAACRTVEDVALRPPHSLHAYFLLGGDPKVPIIYEVDRIRDGKSFTTRRVVAIQHGHAIFSMSVSFHVAEQGLCASVHDAGRAASPTRCRAKPRSEEHVLPQHARSGAPLLRARAADRTAGRSSINRYLGERLEGRPLSYAGSAPPAGCRTSRRSINACSPMRPT